MCGIVGLIDTAKRPLAPRVEAMMAGIPYRGPDGSGQLCLEEEGVALGHRRLSIIDLSPAGRQPMSDEAQRLWITYNGEIYNYLEIRRELQSLGHQFRSDSDTEVLLIAYKQWGAACLQRCMGMYAFAIWDRDKRELFAARDRLGIKPFYYQVNAEGLLFASEVKSILAVDGARRGVDTSLVDAYMEFGYVPGEQTMHQGVERLLPGHTLTWRAGRVTLASYWDLSFQQQHESSLAENAARLRELLQRSVDLHLRSDVPLGVFLSGGLDSSAVVGLLAPGARRGINTFSVAYDFGPEYDETPYARAVSAAFGTEHHEIRVTPRQFVDFVPDYIWHMDEPVTEAAAISLYYVARLARTRVVVALSGEGSDELFAGYDFYRYNMALEKLRGALGGGVFRRLAALLRGSQRLAKLRKYLHLAGEPLEQRYRGISSYEPEKKAALYTAGFAAAARAGNARCAAFLERLFERTRNFDPLSRLLYFDTKTWLVDDLLIKADRMSMANSLELRVPFLDHRVVEYAATLPSAHKIRGANTKLVLKRSLADLLPRRILQRKKMGFPTPLEIMFRGELFGYACETLLSQRALNRGLFEPARVRQLLDAHHGGRAANHREIWQLLVLEEWHRRFGY